MALTMREVAWSRTGGQAYGEGPATGYEVRGLPEGEARIAYFDHSWQILRTTHTNVGEWSGKYETAEAALNTLQAEIETR